MYVKSNEDDIIANKCLLWYYKFSFLSSLIFNKLFDYSSFTEVMCKLLFLV